MSMLKTQRLVVGYEKKRVVEDINLDIKKGQMVCLMGPNGSGKSTILKSLSALLSPLEGEILLQGRELKGYSRKRLSQIMAVVLTEKLSAGYLNVFEVASMGRQPHTGFLGGMRKQDVDIVMDCLKLVNAQELAGRYFNELSDGERQKVMLARALAQEPELIILDEPTTHLDIRHKLEVLSILKRLGEEKGITVILSLHEVDLALKSCDVAVMVKAGKIASMGRPEQVGSDEEVCGLYDIKCAGFSAFLGTMELSNRNNPRIFVAGGGGRGTGVYRQLTRKGIGFYTGILHENDVDCHVARTMGVVVIVEKDFEKIGDTAVKNAEELISKVDAVIDSGFPVSEINRANLRLIMNAAVEGKRVYTLRSETECRRLFGDWAKAMVPYEDAERRITG